MQKTQPATQTTQQQSHMLVISHNKEEFRLLSDILQHYFPHHVNINEQQQQQQNINEKDNKNIENDDDNKLLIKNKYYKAEVKMSNMLWQQTQLWRYNVIVQEEGHQQQQDKIMQEQNQQNHTTQQQQPIQTSQTSPNIQQPKKYDLMIMLITQTHQQQIDLSSLDTLIQTINPDEFVLLINTKEVQNQWKYQQVIMEKCNNFIQIVKEDLLVIKKNKPVWSRGALLSSDDEENIQTGVFSVLDRIETTRWATMVDIKHQQNKKKNNGDNTNNKKEQEEQLKLSKEQEKLLVEQTKREQKIEQIVHGEMKENTQKSTQIKHQQQQNKKQFNASLQSSQDQQQHNQQPINNNNTKQQQHEQKQVDEQKLQQQMLKFQQMMSQMMSFKIQSQQMSNNQRKQKAQQLFTKMFSNFMN